ncbi:MAG: sigma-70 family RNA polymerase sigma factor [Rudaea sp.]
MTRFNTTQWSLVLGAKGEGGDARAALEALCRTYRPPVLAFVRNSGYPHDAAEDLTQSFFTRFLEREYFAEADPARGRFRAYLMTAVRHFLINAASEARAVKRGGRMRFESMDDAGEHLSQVDGDTPERAFEQAWALVVLDSAMRRLRKEAQHAGKESLFDQLRGFLSEQPSDDDYARVATLLNLRRNTVAVSVHRLRHRLRELVREEVAQTAADHDAFDTELRELRGALGAAAQ